MEHVADISRAPTLDGHGATSRCLLRLWENEGNLRLSDEEFLGRYRDRFPHWEQRPGELDTSAICDLARELGLASGVAVVRDYAHVLRMHRAGAPLLVMTERTPFKTEQSDVARGHALLLEEMDEHSFIAWCPFESGGSDLLPRAARIWWDRWFASAYVFSRPART